MIGNGNHGDRPAPTLETYDIRIDRDGSWWHEGQRVARPGLVRLFASVLSRDADGAYWLTTPAERGRVEVEDAPFVAVEMTVHGTGKNARIELRTNLDEGVTVDAAHPLTARDGKLYVTIRDGLEALLSRPVYYELLGTLPGGETGVWSGGEYFPVGEIT